MNLNVLDKVLKLFRNGDTITLDDIMTKCGSNCTDGIEIMMELMEKGLIRDAGEGVFAVFYDADKVEILRAEEGLQFVKLSTKALRELGEKLTEEELDIIKCFFLNTKKALNEVHPDYLDAVDSLCAKGLVIKVDGILYPKIREKDIKALETAYEMGKKEESRQKQSEIKRQRAQRMEELKKKRKETESVASTEREEENPAVEETESEPTPPPQSDGPDFDFISKRAGSLLGKKTDENSDEFDFAFQGITGAPVVGRISPKTRLKDLICKVSSLVSDDKKKEVFGEGKLLFNLIQSDPNRCGELASVFVDALGQDKELSWTAPLDESCGEEIDDANERGEAVKFLLVPKTTEEVS